MAFQIKTFKTYIKCGQSLDWLYLILEIKHL